MPRDIKIKYENDFSFLNKLSTICTLFTQLSVVDPCLVYSLQFTVADQLKTKIVLLSI